MKKILLFTILISTFVQASELRELEWQQISSKDGITVFRPTKYDHESGIVPIRFKATLKHKIDRVLSVLSDDDRKPEWMPNAKTIQKVEHKAINDFTTYYRYDSPWPFKDRDFIVHNKGKFDSKNLVVNVNIKSVKHPKDPSDGSAVRGTTYDGFTIIAPQKDGTTKVEMAFLNDFGGFIPTFVINLVQKKWPYKFMQQLRTQLDKNDIVINPAFQRPAR
jgi:hypothetical protein